MAKKGRQIRKKKIKIRDTKGIIHIHSSFNNTIITVSDKDGNVLAWSSGGKIGYKGSKKSTSFAAQLATQEVCKQVFDMGLRSVDVEVGGPGSGRESSIKTVQTSHLEITSIKDVTPIPHNGCRPPKKRRI
ncbi:MAG: 30S ribosomal protein S11 [Candidatus Cloacimonadota bacterium]|nr:MAG: 30S ribosomal protein S11 [Candidatus Cloacimonadota bacterium]